MDLSNTPAPPDELRSDVRRELATSLLDSLKAGGALLGVVLALMSFIAWGYHAAGRFTFEFLQVLLLATAATVVGGVVVLEFFRLHRRSVLLRALLASEKYYEDLLRQARSERDAVTTERQQLQLRLDMLSTVRQLLHHAAAPPTSQSDATQDSGDTNGQ